MIGQLRFGDGDKLHNNSNEQAHESDPDGDDPLVGVEWDGAREFPQKLDQNDLEGDGEGEHEQEDLVIERVCKHVEFLHFPRIHLVENLQDREKCSWLEELYRTKLSIVRFEGYKVCKVRVEDFKRCRYERAIHTNLHGS